MLVRILPPTREKYPILMYRSNVTQKVSLPLCKICADQHYQGICKHSDWDRSWPGVYTSPELSYAVRLGYRILAFYEVYNYRKRGKPFSTYIKTLAFLKIRVRTIFAMLRFVVDFFNQISSTFMSFR